MRPTLSSPGSRWQSRFTQGLFNIGGEGQAYLGGLGVAFACLALDHYVPWYVTLPFAILGSALMGAAWAFIPAWLQATRGSHVVITTIMFNFIAASLMVYLLNGFLKKPGSMQNETRTFEDGGRLPFLNDIFPSFGFGFAPGQFGAVCCFGSLCPGLAVDLADQARI